MATNGRGICLNVLVFLTRLQIEGIGQKDSIFGAEEERTG